MAALADPAHSRLALLIATSDYSDPALGQLRAPGHDASDLAEVLGIPRIGGFVVQTLINARCGADRRPNDQLLIYLSCHGVLDDRGRLYYAATDTRRQRTAATAIAAAWLNERLEDCRARSQIVILDCCHSGAFAGGAKGEPDLALEERFKPHGRGRVVLTASRGTEYSFEGDQPSGAGVRSVFTRAIVDGLRTGDADRDKDGLITVTDIYHHVYERVRSAEPRQTPELWTYGAEGDVLLAYSVRGAVIEPVALDEDLRLTLQSPRPRVRETAVAELAELLDSGRPGLALSARQALQQVSDEDIPRVAAVAQVALEASPGAAVRKVSKELADRDQRERARQEAQEAARRQAEEQAQREAQEAARRQAEEQAQREAQEAARRQRGLGVRVADASEQVQREALHDEDETPGQLAEDLTSMRPPQAGQGQGTPRSPGSRPASRDFRRRLVIIIATSAGIAVIGLLTAIIIAVSEHPVSSPPGSSSTPSARSSTPNAVTAQGVKVTVMVVEDNGGGLSVADSQVQVLRNGTTVVVASGTLNTAREFATNLPEGEYEVCVNPIGWVSAVPGTHLDHGFICSPTAVGSAPQSVTFHVVPKTT
jgi:Caspase domain